MTVLPQYTNDHSPTSHNSAHPKHRSNYYFRSETRREFRRRGNSESLGDFRYDGIGPLFLERPQHGGSVLDWFICHFTFIRKLSITNLQLRADKYENGRNAHEVLHVGKHGTRSPLGSAVNDSGSRIRKNSDVCGQISEVLRLQLRPSAPVFRHRNA